MRPTRNEMAPLSLFSHRALSPMKFTIEVVRSSNCGRVDVLHRITADEISPKRVKVRAEQLLQFWHGRGATSARVLNAGEKELYVASAPIGE